MVEIFKTIGRSIEKCSEPEVGTWINVVAPTDEEVKSLASQIQLDIDSIKAALDEEERAHIELEENHTLIIIDVPIEDRTENTYFSTLPLGIVLMNDYIVTICTKKLPLIDTFCSGNFKAFTTQNQVRFLLLMLFRNAAYFLHYLKRINQMSNSIEKDMIRSYSNKEIIKMLRLQKSLVYFSNSIKTNESVMLKLKRFSFIRDNADAEDLMEDVVIEIEQAMEMARTYTAIITGVAETLATLADTQLNRTMKLLTGVTIILCIPTMISGLYGMNVPLPGASHPQMFWFITSGIVALAGIISFLMRKMRIF